MSKSPAHLTLPAVKAAGLAALKGGRLSCQGPTPACRYRDDSGFPCVIGAALSAADAARFEGNSIGSLLQSGFVVAPPEDHAGLLALQAFHDTAATWADERNLATLRGEGERLAEKYRKAEAELRAALEAA